MSPDYFRTLGIALVDGRDFTRHDDSGVPGVVIVNQSLAKHLWPGQSAIGKRISMPDPQGPRRPPMEVIGVAADTKSRAFTTDAVLLMYLPVLQNYDGRTYLVVRARSNPSATLAAVERLLQGIDKDLTLYGGRTMSEHVARSLWQQRMAAVWVAAIATLALVLAAIGLYGLMAQSMAQRTREIGIRMALGAAPGAGTRLVVREGMVLALAGLVIGTPVALDLSGLLRGLIPGLSGGDPVSLLAAALVLLFVMLAACWIPARRAASVEPVRALRTE